MSRAGPFPEGLSLLLEGEWERTHTPFPVSHLLIVGEAYRDIKRVRDPWKEQLALEGAPRKLRPCTLSRSASAGVLLRVGTTRPGELERTLNEHWLSNCTTDNFGGCYYGK